jgi:hypothetical protein
LIRNPLIGDDQNEDSGAAYINSREALKPSGRLIVEEEIVSPCPGIAKMLPYTTAEGVEAFG